MKSNSDKNGVGILDLHNGDLPSRLERLAKALRKQESGEMQIVLVASSRDIFLKDLHEYLGV